MKRRTYKQDLSAVRAALLGIFLLVVQTAYAQNDNAARDRLEEPPPRDLVQATLVEHLGERIPLDLSFRDHTGRPVQLKDFFDGRRPVVLNLMYNKCPMLCSMVLNGLQRGLAETEWSVGEQFRVLTVSIDPRDNVRDAADRRATLLSRYKRPSAEQGWHMLIGAENNLQRLSDAVGFKYFYDAKINEYAHPAAIILLTPDGKVARYLYGIQYDPKDLRFGLLEASEGRSVTTVERILMYCYHYDPQGKRYAVLAVRVMQLGGVLTVVVLGIFLGGLWYREKRRRGADERAALSARRAGATNPVSAASDTARETLSAESGAPISPSDGGVRAA